MSALELVKLGALMQHTSGSPDVKIGLIDGPVVTTHRDLTGEYLRETFGHRRATCTRADSAACMQGLLSLESSAQSVVPQPPQSVPSAHFSSDRSFSEAYSWRDRMPSATPNELVAAITECIDAGAQVINLSLALLQPSTKGEHAMQAALDHALRRGVIVVAAAGNLGTVGSSAITRHPWVIPVVACDSERALVSVGCAQSTGVKSEMSGCEGTRTCR